MRDADGHIFLLSETFHGEPVRRSNQVPANLGAGSDSSALIYADWSDLIIAYWSAVDLLANPYHPDVASKGGLKIHAFLDADISVRNPEAFIANVEL